MSELISTKPKRVMLSLAQVNSEEPASKDVRPPQHVRQLFQRARELNIPLHHDPQIAAVLAALRMKKSVPTTVYAAAAALLACVYDAAQTPE